VSPETAQKAKDKNRTHLFSRRALPYRFGEPLFFPLNYHYREATPTNNENVISTISLRKEPTCGDQREPPSSKSFWEEGGFTKCLFPQKTLFYMTVTIG
jgi:hypothetical protein